MKAVRVAANAVHFAVVANVAPAGPNIVQAIRAPFADRTMRIIIHFVTIHAPAAVGAYF